MLKWWLKDSDDSSFTASVQGTGTEIDETVAGVADTSDACVVFLNAQAGEGADRTELYNATADRFVISPFHILLRPSYRYLCSVTDMMNSWQPRQHCG